MEKGSVETKHPEALIAALRRVLRPLVRLLISRGILFPLAAEILREQYIGVASREFPVPGKRQTDSRVHLLTGVHRKDVKRLRRLRAPEFLSPRRASMTSQLIARWTTLEEYRDARGAPRPLPRVADAGPSFEMLVRSVSTDIRPRAVLDEWLRLGIAEVDAAECVRLKVDAFVPPEGSDEMAYYFGRNVHDHVAAAVHNLLGSGEPLLERAAFYNHLTPEAAEEVRAVARELGMQALREVNARAMALQRRDSGKAEATRRVTFGAYFYTQDESHEEEPPADDEQ